MFSKQTYSERRAELCRRVGTGLIVLPGNQLSPNNYPNNAYYFRQDSTFRYYFGLMQPALVGVLDAETGASELYGDDFTVDDIIWTGPQPTLHESGATVGITATFPAAELQKRVAAAQKAGRTVHYLPPYRGETKLQLSALLGLPVSELHAHKSADLMFAVAGMREVKSAEEIEALERAFLIGYDMHLKAMQMCRAGVVEREIAGAIEGISKAHGLGVSFPSIVSQHGETLHNLSCDGVLQNGRLLLVDAGAESVDNYCSDHTRTYPVSGHFSPLQRDIYNIVLRAHDTVPQYIRAGVMYTDVHMAAYRILAEGLHDLGLIEGAPETAVEAGAMYLFMPHGLGHGLGMDVHDCEGMGERSFDFSTLLDRARESATCVHRATWRLRAGTVMSDEPGIYFIPALIDKSRREGLYKGIVNYSKLEALYSFGGIRIEDDVLVEEGGCRFIGSKHIPSSVEELEAVVGK